MADEQDRKAAFAIWSAYRKSGLPCEGAKLVAAIRAEAYARGVEDAAKVAEIYDIRGDTAAGIRKALLDD